MCLRIPFVMRLRFLVLLGVLRCAWARRTSLRENATAADTACPPCEMVHLDSVVSINWGLFPPKPVPGYTMTVYCTPNPEVRWQEESLRLKEALDDCNVTNELGSSDQKKCKEQSASVSKRAEILGIPAAYMRQMVVCGRCTVCKAFQKVRRLWERIKAAVRSVVDKLKKVKVSLFGYSYASKDVREEMQQRFDRLFPKDGQGQAKDVEDEDHEEWVEEIEEILKKHLSDKEPDKVQEHLSLLQLKVEEVEQQEEALMARAMDELTTETRTQRRKFEQQLPEMLSNRDCREVLQFSEAESNLAIGLSVTFPNIVGAILRAVVLDMSGALHALLPTVSISATPRGGVRRMGAAERCIEAIRKSSEPHMEGCTHELPLMACTARTFQRVMQKSLSEQWWPLMHNAEGTFGSIDLGYKYDDLMHSLQCSSKRSCLDKGLASFEHMKEADLTKVLDNSSLSQSARMSELQCSFTGAHVDSEDGGKKLPVFTDKIWAAALKAHGFTINVAPGDTRACPDVLPWVVAFCAHDLQCTKPAKGFYPATELDVGLAKAEKLLKPLKGTEIDAEWKKLMYTRFDVETEADAYEWSLLWTLANQSHQEGTMASWPEILEGLEDKKAIYWLSTRKYWEKVLFVALQKLQLRHQEAEERSLASVFRNLQDIFETKFCSPGALGGLNEDNLERLGVTDVIQVAIHSLNKEERIKGMWTHWMVLQVKFNWKTTSSKRIANFKKLIKDTSCSCMCYEACGKMRPSAVSKCQDLRQGTTKKRLRRGRPKIRTQSVVIDRITVPGFQKLERVDLQVVTKKGAGECGTRLKISSRFLPPVYAFIAQCDVPEYFEQSPSEDMKITAVLDPFRGEELYDYSDFVKLHRPYGIWDTKTWDITQFHDEKYLYPDDRHPDDADDYDAAFFKELESEGALDDLDLEES